MQECHVIGIELFVSGSNTTKVLDAREEALDQIAILVQVRVVGAELLSIGARGDDCLGAAGLDVLNQGIGIVALVGYYRIGANVRDQLGGSLDISELTRTEDQAQRIAKSIQCGVHFCAQSATRSTDRLRAFFWAAPEEYWCARTIVLSRNTCSKSASFASSANALCQTPLFDQRPKRLYTLFQRPNSAGRSRHGLPVRAIHSTASINCRLSSPLRAGSPVFPGNIDSKRCHWSLRNHRRTILNSPKYQDVSRLRAKVTAPNRKILNVNSP